jgi:hypothetical protein
VLPPSVRVTLSECGCSPPEGPSLGITFRVDEELLLSAAIVYLSGTLVSLEEASCYPAQGSDILEGEQLVEAHMAIKHTSGGDGCVRQGKSVTLFLVTTYEGINVNT